MLDAQETSLFVDNVNICHRNNIYRKFFRSCQISLINYIQILEDSKIARQQLSDIESRHNEVLKLEKSLTEVRDIFAEMAFLIEKQVSISY